MLRGTYVISQIEKYWDAKEEERKENEGKIIRKRKREKERKKIERKKKLKI